MSITTSVVICAYTQDRWTDLLAAVASVEAQFTPAHEIVVVIDHHDDLLQRAQHALPQVTVIASTGPKGLSGARNTGIGATSGEVVAFLDDDATAEPDWLGLLTAPYADPNVLGVGGGADPRWETARPTWWPAEFGWVIGCSFVGQPTDLDRVRNLMGCSMSVRRSVLDAVGGFDTDLGRTATTALGCEETELCIRAAALFPAGVFLHEPRSIVRHRVPARRATWRYFRERCYAEGLSKARVTRTVGADAGLASERAYVRRTLPGGVRRGLAQTLSGDPRGLTRAAAIVAGLGFTGAGFVRGRVSRPAFADPSDTAALAVAPVLPLVVDVSEPLPTLPSASTDPAYASALCLVTRAGTPIAKVRIDLAAADPHQPLASVLASVAQTDVAAAGAGTAAPTVSTHPSPVPQLVGQRVANSEVLPSATPTPTGGAPASLRAGAPAGGESTDLPRPTVTVAIATRNRPERLAECLESVFAGTRQPDHVIVVDNAPSDDTTADLLARMAEQDLRLSYVREDRPGLAHAHNAVLPHLVTDLVAFTDDDVLVDRRWLAALVDAFTADDRPDCVTGMIAPRELDTLAQQWVEGNVTYDKGLERRTFDTGAHRPADPLFPYTAGAFGSGANMAFRSDYLTAVGGFDAALGTGTVAMGGDDLAAFYDVVSSGHRLVYQPAAIVLHQHHRDYASLRRQTYGYGAGLGAHLTRCFLDDPRMVLTLLRHAAATRRRAAGILQPPTVTGLPAYPADLRRQQRRGLLSGPFRYLASRHRLRAVARTTAPAAGRVRVTPSVGRAA